MFVGFCLAANLISNRPAIVFRANGQEPETLFLWKDVGSVISDFNEAGNSDWDARFADGSNYWIYRFSIPWANSAKLHLQLGNGFLVQVSSDAQNWTTVLESSTSDAASGTAWYTVDVSDFLPLIYVRFMDNNQGDGFGSWLEWLILEYETSDNVGYVKNGNWIMLCTTWDASGAISADFSSVDSNYVTGSEKVTEEYASGTQYIYGIYYKISSSNTFSDGLKNVVVYNNTDISNWQVFLDNSAPAGSVESVTCFEAGSTVLQFNCSTAGSVEYLALYVRKGQPVDQAFAGAAVFPYIFTDGIVAINLVQNVIYCSNGEWPVVGDDLYMAIVPRDRAGNINWSGAYVISSTFKVVAKPVIGETGFSYFVTIDNFGTGEESPYIYQDSGSAVSGTNDRFCDNNSYIIYKFEHDSPFCIDFDVGNQYKVEGGSSTSSLNTICEFDCSETKYNGFNDDPYSQPYDDNSDGTLCQDIDYDEMNEREQVLANAFIRTTFSDSTVYYLKFSDALPDDGYGSYIRFIGLREPLTISVGGTVTVKLRIGLLTSAGGAPDYNWTSDIRVEADFSEVDPDFDPERVSVDYLPNGWIEVKYTYGVLSFNPDGFYKYKIKFYYGLSTNCVIWEDYIRLATNRISIEPSTEGWFQSEDGKLAVFIPKHSYPYSYEICLSSWDASDALCGGIVASTISKEVILNKAIKVRLYGSFTMGKSYVIKYFDGSSWIELPTSVSYQQGYAEVACNFFGAFAVFEGEAPSPSEVPYYFLTPNGDGVNDVVTIFVPEVGKGTKVRVKVSSLTGKTWNVLTQIESLSSGLVIKWDGRDAGGSLLSTGPYLITVFSKGKVVFRKVVFLAR